MISKIRMYVIPHHNVYTIYIIIYTYIYSEGPKSVTKPKVRPEVRPKGPKSVTYIYSEYMLK